MDDHQLFYDSQRGVVYSASATVAPHPRKISIFIAIIAAVLFLLVLCVSAAIFMVLTSTDTAESKDHTTSRIEQTSGEHTSERSASEKDADRAAEQHSDEDSLVADNSPSQPAPSAQQPAPSLDAAAGYITTVSNGAASYPSCDGHYILIHNSVVEQPGVSTSAAIESALAAAPAGATFTYPGRCSSLRAQLNGANIYPVYTDYGWDSIALCMAWRDHGGNPRTLNNNADFTSPC